MTEHATKINFPEKHQKIEIPLVVQKYRFSRANLPLKEDSSILFTVNDLIFRILFLLRYSMPILAKKIYLRSRLINEMHLGFQVGPSNLKIMWEIKIRTLNYNQNLYILFLNVFPWRIFFSLTFMEHYPQQRENMTQGHFNLIRVYPKNFSSKYSVFSTNTVANYLHLQLER